MKTIYFVRHGQTNLSRAWRHQLPTSRLSKLGIVQAQNAGLHFAKHKVDLIISSTLTRAMETAEEISKYHDCPMEYSELFIELKRPSSLLGVHWLSPKSLWTMWLIYVFAGAPDRHISDEENLNEFHARAQSALDYLASREEQNIIVVTHRGFMANMMERMRLDGLDTIKQYRRSLWKNFEIAYCSYVTTEWTPEGENGETLRGTWSVKDGYTQTS